jgi:MFS family permease
MRRFTLIWTGQVASLLGSGMTWFVLGVWIYETTGSALLFALSLFSATLPQVLLLPVAGVLVDRWDRRRVLILADAAAAALSVGLALLFLLDVVAVWHVYLANALGAAVTAFKTPAFVAATGSLVPREQLARASGMSDSGQAASQIAAPMLGAFLYTLIGAEGVILVDVGTFVLSLLVLLAVPIPRPPRGAPEGKPSFLREARYGWSFLAGRPGLPGLLAYFVVLNFFLNLSWVAVTPAILDLASPRVLGAVLSTGYAGMLAGGVMMGAWGGPARRVDGVLLGGALFGGSLVALGLATGAVALAGAMFGLLFSVPLINGSFRAIWQGGAPPEVHGRVASAILMVARSSVPVAFLVGGPLVESVFEPSLLPGGPLAGSVGRLLGVGPGRGAGLMFLLLGLAFLAVTYACLASPAIRGIEEAPPGPELEPARH